MRPHSSGCQWETNLDDLFDCQCIYHHFNLLTIWLFIWSANLMTTLDLADFAPADVPSQP
jgi:hypothetical protein